MAVKELIYPNGYKSWSPAKEFEKAYYKLENFDLNVGSNYARIKAEDKIWEGLGFVLQWAKWTKEVNSINANSLYVILKAGSNRAGFI